LFDEDTDTRPLEQAISLVKEKYNLEVIIEPGATVVREACYIVSSVIDIISSNEKTIAVLDTTVNHMPEVFEYQYRPDIVEEYKNGNYSYILEGSTCLAGDHFGEYNLDSPLEIGSNITFTGMGAYTMVKAHMFNGINLPSIYALTEGGDLELQKQYTYEDFRSRCGVESENESLRKNDILKFPSRKRNVG
jgi:carboxynorspermidine decarboxylase